MAFDITDYGAVADGVTDNAPAIQQAIDACTAQGGGTVLVPAGKTFRCGLIHLKANVNLHLSPGSLLQAVPEYGAYAGQEKGHFCIRAHEAHNVSITGTGTLDGQSHAFMVGGTQYKYDGQPGRPRILGLFGCRKVRISDVTFLNGADWAIHPCGCEDVVIHAVTILNDLKTPNCDGIDPDHCRNVRISDCHIQAGDDGIVVKTRPEWSCYGACENITVTNCTIISTSCALKIGTETANDIRNVHFSDCVVYNSNRGLGVMHRDAGTVENIFYSNISVQTRLFADCWWGKAEPIHISAVPRILDKPLGPIRNLRFQNIVCRGENGVFIQGCEQSRPEDILLSDVRLHIEKTSRWPAGFYDIRPCPPQIMPVGGQTVGEPTPWGAVCRRSNVGFFLQCAKRVTLRGCELSWGREMPEAYSLGLESHDVEDLRLKSFRAQGAHPGIDHNHWIEEAGH